MTAASSARSSAAELLQLKDGLKHHALNFRASYLVGAAELLRLKDGLKRTGLDCNQNQIGRAAELLRLKDGLKQGVGHLDGSPGPGC